MIRPREYRGITNHILCALPRATMRRILPELEPLNTVRGQIIDQVDGQIPFLHEQIGAGKRGMRMLRRRPRGTRKTLWAAEAALIQFGSSDGSALRETPLAASLFEFIQTPRCANINL